MNKAGSRWSSFNFLDLSSLIVRYFVTFQTSIDADRTYAVLLVARLFMPFFWCVQVFNIVDVASSQWLVEFRLSRRTSREFRTSSMMNVKIFDFDDGFEFKLGQNLMEFKDGMLYAWNPADSSILTRNVEFQLKHAKEHPVQVSLFYCFSNERRVLIRRVVLMNESWRNEMSLWVRAKLMFLRSLCARQSWFSTGSTDI